MYSDNIFSSLLLAVNCREGLGGRLSGHQTATGRIGTRAKGPSHCHRSHGLLYLSTADSEEVTSRTGSNGHLRKDGQVFEIPQQQTLRAGQAPAQGGIEEKLGGSTRALFERSSRAGPEVTSSESAVERYKSP